LLIEKGAGLYRTQTRRQRGAAWLDLQCAIRSHDEDLVKSIAAIATFALATLFMPLSVSGATVNVTVGPLQTFVPPAVTIAPGDTVQWDFAGGLHSATSDSSSAPESWDSGVKSSGSFAHTFTTAGDWPYYCSIHSVAGGTAMNGVIHVVAVAPAVPLMSRLTLSLLLITLVAAALFVVRAANG
jgi:plastocyanin